MPPATTRITTRQRRARLGLRHHLAAPAATPAAVARAMLALHSTDPATVFLSIRARMPSCTVSEVEDELYRHGNLVRMLGMRRTLFVVPTELAPVVQAGCTRAVAERLRRTYLKYLTDGGVGDDAWLAEVQQATERAVTARGEATGAQLSADVPQLRSTLHMNEGKAYGGPQAITSWVLGLVAAEGRIARGRPRGTWTSSQWTWSPAPHGMNELAVAPAQVELARRWLAAFGPATIEDLRWWTGWTLGEVRRALAAIEPVEVDLDGTVGLVLPDDLAPVPDPAPWVALLPALDPTAMGWAQRSWYLGEHTVQLFDTTGNIGPTVWSDGHIVGGWSQRPNGEVVHRLLEDVGAETSTAIEEEVARLATWLGAVRVAARGRRLAPLEKELGG